METIIRRRLSPSINCCVRPHNTGWYSLFRRCCGLHKGKKKKKLRFSDCHAAFAITFKICTSLFKRLGYLPWAASLGSEPGFIHFLLEWDLKAWHNCFVLFLPERKNLILEPWTVVCRKEPLRVSVKVVNPQAGDATWDIFLQIYIYVCWFHIKPNKQACGR